MDEFQKMRKVCDRSSANSGSVIDDFLLSYADEREGLEHKIARQLVVHRVIIGRMPDAWAGSLITQFIVHKLFKKDGLAGKYFQHAEVQNRSVEELEYLQFQIEHPWRFSYCSIQRQVYRHFYAMKDALSEDIVIVYSPGISETLGELGYSPSLWFLLIGFNGECWQTYGTLAYFRGIQPFDLFFFAKQINPDIVFQNQVQEVIESNPVSFMLSWIAGNLPVACHKKDMLVFNKSEYYVKEFNPDNYAEDFFIEKKHPIYMLSLKRWHRFPHFAKFFYHAKQNLLILTSMTVRGYDSLVKAMNRHGNDFPENPDVMVTPAMVSAAKEVLKTDVVMSPYEKHFQKEIPKSHSEEIKKINVFLRELMDRLNREEDYDIAELAVKAGIDVENAERIAENVIKKMSDDSWKRG